VRSAVVVGSEMRRSTDHLAQETCRSVQHRSSIRSSAQCFARHRRVRRQMARCKPHGEYRFGPWCCDVKVSQRRSSFRDRRNNITHLGLQTNLLLLLYNDNYSCDAQAMTAVWCVKPYLSRCVRSGFSSLLESSELVDLGLIFSLLVVRVD
jgi:hypothetical protein